MDYTEEEIEELMQLIGGEEFLTSYKEYMQKRNKLIEGQKEESLKKKVQPFTQYNNALFDANIRILDLEFGFQLILFLLMKSDMFTPDMQKSIDIITRNKKFYT